MSSGPRTPLIGGEQYIAEVIEVEEITRPNFDGKMQDFLKVKFNVESFRDGGALEDINGDPVEGGRWVWKDVDFERVGFKQDGTPSIARQFFMSVMGIADMTAKVPAVTMDDMMNKKVVLTLIVYQKKNGDQANRITVISPLSQRGRRKAQQETPAQEPAALPEEMQAAIDGLANMTEDEA